MAKRARAPCTCTHERRAGRGRAMRGRKAWGARGRGGPGPPLSVLLSQAREGPGRRDERGQHSIARPRSKVGNSRTLAMPLCPPTWSSVSGGMLLDGVTSATQAAAAHQRGPLKGRLGRAPYAAPGHGACAVAAGAPGVSRVGGQQGRCRQRLHGWAVHARAHAHLAPPGRVAPPQGTASCAAPRRAAAPWQPPGRCPGWRPPGSPRSWPAQTSTCASRARPAAVRQRPPARRSSGVKHPASVCCTLPPGPIWARRCLPGMQSGLPRKASATKAALTPHGSCR